MKFFLNSWFFSKPTFKNILELLSKLWTLQFDFFKLWTLIKFVNFSNLRKFFQIQYFFWNHKLFRKIHELFKKILELFQVCELFFPKTNDSFFEIQKKKINSWTFLNPQNISIFAKNSELFKNLTFLKIIIFLWNWGTFKYFKILTVNWSTEWGDDGWPSEASTAAITTLVGHDLLSIARECQE